MSRTLWPERREGTLAPAADMALPAPPQVLPQSTASVRQLAAACGPIAAIWLAAVTWRLAGDLVAPWDSKNQFYAFFRFLASSIHSGATPFWNPYHYGGHPSIADPQSLIFAPLFVLWALVDAAPSMQTFDLLVAAHLLIGGLAVGIWGWRAEWPPAASVLAAAVFMFGAGASGRLDHPGLIITYGLFPPALLLLQGALQRRSIGLAVAFAIVAAALALGRNQVALLLCFVLLAAAVAEIAADEKPLRYLVSRAPVLATMAVVCLAIIAAPVLLTIQFAQLSNRPAVTLAEALTSSLYPANLAMLAVPDIFGSHAAVQWVPSYPAMPELAGMDDSFGYLFVGSVPVVILLWFGVAGGWAWRRGRRLFFAALVLSTLFMLGRYTPLFVFAFDHVPGVSYFRRPVDASFMFMVALALLCGHLLADYVRDGVPLLRRWRIACVLVGAASVLAWAVIYSAGAGHGVAALIEVLRVAPVALLAIAMLASAATAPARRFVAAGVALIAVAELMWWNAASRINAVPRQAYAVLEQPVGHDAKALAALEQAIAERHRAGARPRVEILGASDAFQNLAIVRGIEAINGYNPLRIGIYDRVVVPGETTHWADERPFPGSFDGYDGPVARALGLEFVVLDRPIEAMRHAVRRPVADLIYGGTQLWIYRLRDALPRLTFTTRFQIADADGFGRRGELLATPSADRALLDDDTPPDGAYWSLPAGQAGKARIVSWRPDRVEIEATSPLGGILVLHDTYYPGWVAEIDGKRAEILRADVLFRGLEVPPGDRRIVFRYAPLSLENLADALATALHRRRW